MPAIKLICNLTTAPLASDDMHIVCLVLGFYRAIQFVCLVPLLVLFFIGENDGRYMTFNGLPNWCNDYGSVAFGQPWSGAVPILQEEVGFKYVVDDGFEAPLIQNALAFFIIDVAWMIMVWQSSSVGTPTEPQRRDIYIRNLVKVKIFFINLYPIAMLVMGLYYIYDMRENNYGCGDDGTASGKRPDETVQYGLLCALLVTYALEILIWPTIIVNAIIRALRRRRNRVEHKAKRFELKFGCLLKCLSCLFRKKGVLVLQGGKDLKNKGELKDFASHVMCLLNNQTKLGLVLTDMYVGMKMLSRVQGERKVEAIKTLAKKNKLLKRHMEMEEDGNQNDITKDGSSEKEEYPKLRKQRSSILVLQKMNEDETYEICERDILHASVKSEQTLMSDAAHFVEYARCIYLGILNCVIHEFPEDRELPVNQLVIRPDTEECPGFIRELDTLFRDEFRMPCIGLPQAMLCYSNFVNGIASTPYSIMVDNERKAIVIAIRGTLSLEDIVVDTQFVPASLEKVGEVCGFDGKDHCCHKGFLVRGKWMYNDIRKTKVLKTIYSDQSPYKDYNLIICGHSLGAGCASILSLMLRPSFPSLHCFAYEPPGCIFNEEMSEESEKFITSFVRHDDMVPRLSYQNFEHLREEFFITFQRIKVPKIKLFFHLREESYSDRFAAVRNSQVLRPQDSIPTDTAFNKQLEQFRKERLDKNTNKHMKPLYVPGQIIHLVDTSGTENHNETYVPYWASRGEFNQLEISKRMYSDHDIHSLVDILKDIKLGGANQVSLAFHNAPQIYVHDDDDIPEVQLFSCCSNPYGKLPMVLAIFALVANSLTTDAAVDCNFVDAQWYESKVNATIYVNFGLMKYDQVLCDNSTGVCVYNQTQCVHYPPNWTPGPHMTAGRTFHTLASLIGAVALVMILISMCFIYSQRTWRILTVMLLVVVLFQSLIFIMEGEFSWCAEEDVECGMGGAAIQTIVAICIWFLIAVGTGYLARVGPKKQEKKVLTKEEEDEEEEAPTAPTPNEIGL